MRFSNRSEPWRNDGTTSRGWISFPEKCTQSTNDANPWSIPRSSPNLGKSCSSVGGKEQSSSISKGSCRDGGLNLSASSCPSRPSKIAFQNHYISQFQRLKEWYLFFSVFLLSLRLRRCCFRSSPTSQLHFIDPQTISILLPLSSDSSTQGSCSNLSPKGLERMLDRLGKVSIRLSNLRTTGGRGKEGGVWRKEKEVELKLKRSS